MMDTSNFSSASSNLEKQIETLGQLLYTLMQTSTPEEKKRILMALPAVKEALREHPFLLDHLQQLPPESHQALLSLAAIGQVPFVFYSAKESADLRQSIEPLVSLLCEVDAFYDAMGGLIGYHLAVLKLLAAGNPKDSEETEQISYLQPEGISLEQETQAVRRAIRSGIESLPLMAEIYPLGGAGDRLNLIDEASGQPLPAAQLQFCGRSLLEGLIRDLEGREYLHLKLCGNAVVTPIALMTSLEKDNDRLVRALCKVKNWFGRPPESILFFTQPLVPVLTKEGNWAVASPFKLHLKPGGHGVIWKLASDEGILDAFEVQGRKKLLIRQINNPVAGTDNGLLGFCGIGCKEDKAFGFASCPRLLGTPEGMDLLIERSSDASYEYTLTNLEYTDFARKGIHDVPAEEGSSFSAFPSNTNILFADIGTVRELSREHPVPGLIINMKTRFPSLNRQGELQEVEAGRLESTMQNIADFLVYNSPNQLVEGERGGLPTYITFNKRSKTISVTKTSYSGKGSVQGTPEGCYFEMMQNAEELLKEACGMQVPACYDEERFTKQGPAFVFHYHPALGPLYSVIGQKIRGGSLAEGAELDTEIAELEMDNVRIDGSLLITADKVTGASETTGKCHLKNVMVKNKGIDRTQTVRCAWWKRRPVRMETVRITIEGNGEFSAENVAFEGSHEILVPSGTKVTARQTSNGGVELISEPIAKPTWFWNYHFDQDDRIVLTKGQ